MTPVEIPPIVLLVDPDRDALERYSHHFENSGLWVAGTTSYDELLPSAEELRPDIIIADTETDTYTDAGQQRRAALASVKHDPALSGIPLIVLVPPPAENPPDAEVTLRKPVPPELLLRRTREILARARKLRGHSNAVISQGRTLMRRSNQLMEKAAAVDPSVDDRSRLCPNCSAVLEWVERGTVGPACYDYYRWCSSGCGLFCYNRDARQWIKLA
jgi:CheY-like chemotaxis protein